MNKARLFGHVSMYSRIVWFVPRCQWRDSVIHLHHLNETTLYTPLCTHFSWCSSTGHSTAAFSLFFVVGRSLICIEREDTHKFSIFSFGVFLLDKLTPQVGLSLNSTLHCYILQYSTLHYTTLRHLHCISVVSMPPKITTAQKRLLRELRELNENPTEGIVACPISENDLFHWKCLITGPTDTPYEFGVFEATLDFPSDYPLSPPKMKFVTPILHPNVYKDGTVCISILHASGNDPLNYEPANERWGPLQSIEKILLSVSSMIADPNPNSPANVDAAKLWRSNRDKYDEIVRQQVRHSLQL